MDVINGNPIERRCLNSTTLEKWVRRCFAKVVLTSPVWYRWFHAWLFNMKCINISFLISFSLPVGLHCFTCMRKWKYSCQLANRNIYFIFSLTLSACLYFWVCICGRVRVCVCMYASAHRKTSLSIKQLECTFSLTKLSTIKLMRRVVPFRYADRSILWAVSYDEPLCGSYQKKVWDIVKQSTSDGISMEWVIWTWAFERRLLLIPNKGGEYVISMEDTSIFQAMVGNEVGILNRVFNNIIYLKLSKETFKSLTWILHRTLKLGLTIHSINWLKHYIYKYSNHPKCKLHGLVKNRTPTHSAKRIFKDNGGYYK